MQMHASDWWAGWWTEWSHWNMLFMVVINYIGICQGKVFWNLASSFVQFIYKASFRQSILSYLLSKYSKLFWILLLIIYCILSFKSYFPKWVVGFLYRIQDIRMVMVGWVAKDAITEIRITQAQNIGEKSEVSQESHPNLWVYDDDTDIWQSCSLMLFSFSVSESSLLSFSLRGIHSIWITFILWTMVFNVQLPA